ncbi:MAG: PrsW family intramembrane metalloprotease [Rhizobiales bacterium]|nr:PrsW family intramembrane metalloprotease [Hyphomicrobiales bacterium]
MGLFIAASITTVLALCGLVILLRRSDDWRSTAFAFVIALPLQPLMIYAVRLPVDGLLRTTFGMLGWVTIVSMFYAPLTEEPAKWLTALVPRVRHAIAKDPVVLALAVGVGFGIGEIWFLAHALIKSPSYPDLPFWMFGGFVFERLAVCFLHGALLLPPFYALATGHSFLLGGFAGVVAHFLLNFPIYLAGINAFGLGDSWAGVLLLWIALFVLLGGLLALSLSRRLNQASR